MRHPPGLHRPERRIGAVVPLAGLTFGMVVALWATQTLRVRGDDHGAPRIQVTTVDGGRRPSGLPTVTAPLVPLDTLGTDHYRSTDTGSTPTTTAPVEPAPIATPAPAPGAATAPAPTEIPSGAPGSETPAPSGNPADTDTTLGPPTDTATTACAVPSLPATAFAPDSADLGAATEVSLDEIAVALRSTSGAVRIEGHTDIRESGFEGGNDGLSKARAEAVLQALVERDIPRDRLTSEGFGAAVPLDEARTEQAYAKNRRVEIHVAC